MFFTNHLVRKIVLLAAVIPVFAALHAFAQDEMPQPAPLTNPEFEKTQPVETTQNTQTAEVTISPQDSGVDMKSMPSVFFTFWEYAAILDAKKSFQDNLDVRGVSQEELERAIRDSKDLENRPKPPPEEREITLGGILYTSSEEWTIWLNGERVEPDALPKEIIGLNVYEDYIEMKWLDDYTMQVYPLRMRAHQRFNLDTRIFLPG